MQREIKWNRKNKVTLKIAVNAFNKKINELNKLEDKNYLPETLNYNEIKERIKTESELKRYVKDLRSFKNKENQEIYKTEAGEEITKWEYKSIQKNVKNIKRRLTSEKISLETPYRDSRFSLAEMHSPRYHEVVAELERLENFEKTKTGYRFKNFLNYLRNAGSSDYSFKKAIIYKENYMNVIKNFSNLDGYEKLEQKFKSISNPKEFFDFISKTDNINIIDLHYVSDTTMTQSQFYRYLEDLGIELDKNSEVVENY